MFDSTIFRSNAIRHYHDRLQGGVPAPLRIVPVWTGWIFWGLAAVLLLALVLSVAFRVEVRGAGRGVFYVGSGARPLVAPIGGKVGRVLAARGQQVEIGALILELDSVAVQSELLQADRALVDLERIVKPTQVSLDRLAEAQLRGAERRLDVQKEQIDSLEASVDLFKRKAIAQEELERAGLVSPLTAAEAKEALAQAQRSVNSARQALMGSEGEIASLKAKRNGDQLRNQQEAQSLRTRRDVLAFSLAQTRITAPEKGVLEGLHLKPGDPVTPGQSIGRILTGATSLRAFALLAEKDRAQIKPGDLVRVEVDQYPHEDWGALKASILRIGATVATPSEVRELFGEGFKQEGPAYLVELVVPDSQTPTNARRPLESGMGFQARFVLRRQRPIAFLLEPLRRWLE